MNSLDDFVQRHDFPCWCGETKGRVFCRQLFGRRPFVVWRCAACGTHRLLPRALAEATGAAELYNNYAIPRPTPQQEHTLENIALARMHRVGFAFRPGQRVLDVGCGDGLLLEAICRAHGCTGRGIDVDERRIRHAREHRPHAQFECGLFDPSQTAGPHDVIIACAVLEHVLDPVGFLRALAAGLAAGGSIYLLVPNAASLNYRILRSWWRELLSIGEHIHLFTPKSLGRCAAAAGLHVAEFDTDHDIGWPTIEFDSPRNALVAVWACWRECVKRICWLAHRRGHGDLLFARLVAPLHAADTTRDL